jgi:hypothetical protein
MLLWSWSRLLHRQRVFTGLCLCRPKIVSSSFRPSFTTAALAALCASWAVAWCDLDFLRCLFCVAAGVVGDGEGAEAFVNDGGEGWGAADDDSYHGC